MSLVREIQKRYGGKWRYCRSRCQWCCDDGRYVSKVHTGGFDLNGEALPGFGYVLYTDNIGERIYIGKQKLDWFRRLKVEA